ncbi:hypothetical protein IC213_00250 [Clostridioides sp. ES-S-0049-02]|uniref:hypothetical protein n=1 Tax=Clostridioides sp. ES-S-0049-02 TaxID=2770778 RepID=UPI001D129F32|nr:hypothetical protein [Clostridioides sp. ES-S-0049-02]
MIIIRSQDRLDLMRVNRIEVNREQVYAVFEDGVKKIGEYESNERAMKILDRIQKFVADGTEYDYITLNKIRYNANRIFQMPVE